MPLPAAAIYVPAVLKPAGVLPLHKLEDCFGFRSGVIGKQLLDILQMEVAQRRVASGIRLGCPVAIEAGRILTARNLSAGHSPVA